MKRIVRLTESELKGIIKNVIKEDAVLLRKLAYKSKFNFGKYNGQTVEEILRLGKKSYLRFIYYNLEGISFIDEILKDIGIIGKGFDYTIEKPGKDPEYGKEVSEYLFDNLSFKVKSHLGKVNRSQIASQAISNKKDFKRGNLQAWNHGKRTRPKI